MSTLLNWLARGVGIRSPSEVKLSLDSTPTGEEEQREFPNQASAMGLPYDEGPAKTRIDGLARRLAIAWTIFLIYIVIAQGHKYGAALVIFGVKFWIIPEFHLDKAEFIAVFTTTTGAVFGFLVIVANHLFKKSP
jgi:hypothetical protein